MPLINEELRHTDRKTRAAWPWIVVVTVFAAICMLLAVVFSLAVRAGGPSNTTALLVQAPAVQAEQQFADSGNWGGVLQYVQAFPADSSYNFNDKHTHYVLGERAYRKLKKPKSGMPFQSRYRVWVAQLKSPQCQACHSQTMHPRGSPGFTAPGPRPQ